MKLRSISFFCQNAHHNWLTNEKTYQTDQFRWILLQIREQLIEKLTMLIAWQVILKWQIWKSIPHMSFSAIAKKRLVPGWPTGGLQQLTTFKLYFKNHDFCKCEIWGNFVKIWYLKKCFNLNSNLNVILHI